MASAVAFTVHAPATRDDMAQLYLQIESKHQESTATDARNDLWQHVRQHPVNLKGVNIVSQLYRSQYVYRLSLRPPAVDTQQAQVFPIYLEIPWLPLASTQSRPEDMCPPEIGAFMIAPDLLQCPWRSDATSTSQAAAILGGTLAAALLVYSVLPYLRTSNPMRRMWGRRKHNGTEQAHANTTIQQLKATESAGLNTKAMLVFANLPDEKDERGWRDFFDSCIYQIEGKDSAATLVSSMDSRRDIAFHVSHTRIDMTESRRRLKRERYKTIRNRIHLAAMKAAKDEALRFNEFWQM
ncbi:hypothetical protein CCR75_004669 [Bremia lactucae]|uniref:Uncharacterized protein n=1 Tax=Bremia lactucae TaxID=4779 RepID=A0A976FRN4_BRELC|nr:hypothetical protein CCR75_004669 [Bremia lactucae]